MTNTKLDMLFNPVCSFFRAYCYGFDNAVCSFLESRLSEKHELQSFNSSANSSDFDFLFLIVFCCYNSQAFVLYHVPELCTNYISIFVLNICLEKYNLNKNISVFKYFSLHRNRNFFLAWLNLYCLLRVNLFCYNGGVL